MKPTPAKFAARLLVVGDEPTQSLHSLAAAMTAETGISTPRPEPVRKLNDIPEWEIQIMLKAQRKRDRKEAANPARALRL